MTYTKTNWSEMSMTEAAVITALNNCETQYDEITTYAATVTHSSLYYGESYCDSNFYHAGNDGSGSNLIAMKIDGYTYEDIIAGSIPEGIVCIWYGNEDAIPSGFYCCNGSNDTPDLRGKYPIGAGNAYEINESVGNNLETPTGTITVGSHLLTTTELPAHTHKALDHYNGGALPPDYDHEGYYINGTEDAEQTTTTDEDTSTAHIHTGNSIICDSINIKPASVALCYIMRG